jgi:DNA-binding NtrC family response regulator
MPTISPPHVLIVEQDIQIRNFLSHVFERDGFGVSVVSGATAASQLVRSSPPADCLILDLLTTGSATPWFAFQRFAGRIVMISTSSDSSIAEEFHCPYFQKPFSAPALVEEVRRLLVKSGHSLPPQSTAKPHSTLLSPRARETEDLFEKMRKAGAPAVHRLLHTLIECGTCTDRCPGVLTCWKTAALVHEFSAVGAA